MYRLFCAKEDAPGVLSDGAVLQELPVAEAVLTRSKNVSTAVCVRTDPQVTSVNINTTEFAGKVSVEFRDIVFDELIAAALRTPLSTNIRDGVTDATFTFEEVFDNQQYRQWSGMAVDTWQMSVAAGKLVTGAFSFISLQETSTVYQLYNSHQYVAAGSPWTASSNVATILINGSPAATCFQSFDISVNNNRQNVPFVGHAGTSATPARKMAITGTLRNIFDAWGELYDALVYHSHISLAFNVGNLLITLPKVVITTGAVPIGDKNIDTESNYSFQAVADDAGHSIYISRNVVQKWLVSPVTGLAFVNSSGAALVRI